MKVNTKIKQVLNSAPKRLAVTFGLVAAVLVPLGIYAWGPSRDTFTMAKPADHVTFNSITDNPDVGDERNFLRVRDSDKQYWGEDTTNGWTDTIDNVQAGHTYTIRMYVHNNAAANLKREATNVRAHIDLPTRDTIWGKQFEINGYLWSDNAEPNEIWDNIVLKSDKEFHVKVVSAKYYNNIRTEASGGFDLSDEIYTAKGQGAGALLGYEQMDGVIPGCLEYSGYVLVQIQPVFQATPSYDVSKTVDKTTANPGDTINYTITVKNTGNTDLTDVKVVDKLPTYYSQATEQVDAPSTITGSIVKDGQLTIAKLPVNTTATIKISYQIKSADELTCGTTTIKNIVTSTTNEDQTEDDSTNNEVTTVVEKICEYSYDLAKSVDKTTANPGDTLTYTLIFKNTGQLDLTNVVIKDELPTGVILLGQPQSEPAVDMTGDITKDGLTIERVKAGQTIKITLAAKLDISNEELECGETRFVNKASSTTNEDQTEDDNTNNEVVTVVTKVCTPSYDVSKTVDKTTANPGDTINYTITVKNTGNTDLTDVKVVDKLPTYYSQATEQVDAPSTITGSIVKDGQLTIAKLPVNTTATIKISYQIKSADELTCGTTTIKNIVTSTTNEDQTEDDSTNNEVTTVVEKICEPVTPPDEPTPDEPIPESPTVIAQTGASETVATVVAVAALGGTTTAYVNSRKYAKTNRK